MRCCPDALPSGCCAFCCTATHTVHSPPTRVPPPCNCRGCALPGRAVPAAASSAAWRFTAGGASCRRRGDCPPPAAAPLARSDAAPGLRHPATGGPRLVATVRVCAMPMPTAAVPSLLATAASLGSCSHLRYCTHGSSCCDVLCRPYCSRASPSHASALPAAPLTKRHSLPLPSASAPSQRHWQIERSAPTAPHRPGGGWWCLDVTSLSPHAPQAVSRHWPLICIPFPLASRLDKQAAAPLLCLLHCISTHVHARPCGAVPASRPFPQKHCSPAHSMR